MKTVAFGDYMRAHIRESVVILIVGVLALYILFALSMPLWQRGMVVAVLIFGAYEAISKIQGKPSPTKAIQKAMGEAQKGMSMEMPDLDLPAFNQQPEGFGPFQRRKKR